jgi:phage baseplate assembly protein W
MSTEIQTPFGLTPSGGVASTANPATQTQQHIQTLVSTNPGERVMLPKYGVPLSSYVFGADADVVSTAIGQNVSAAVAQWEPSVSLLDIVPVISDTSEGNAQVKIEYAPGAVTNSLQSVSTATVLVGGTVVSNGRGSSG